MSVYITICEECARSLGGIPLIEKFKKKGSDAKCDCCKKDKEVFNSHLFGIQYSGKLMTHSDYRIMNGLNVSEAKPELKSVVTKLIFGKG